MANWIRRRFPSANVSITNESPYLPVGHAWQNISSAYYDDNSFAYMNAATFDAGSNTCIAAFSGYHFTSGEGMYGTGGTAGTASSGATAFTTGHLVTPTVVGIVVYINKFSSAGCVSDALVQLCVDGSGGFGSNKASSGTWGSSGGGAGTLGTAGTYEYGGSRDLWGTAFTWSQVCGTGFGVRFAGSARSANSVAVLGNVSVEVHYKIPREWMEQSGRRGRFVVYPNKRVTGYGKEWISTAGQRTTMGDPAAGTAGTDAFSATMSGTFGTVGAGTHSTAFSAGTFFSAGTVIMALGSAGTIKTESIASTFGTGREIYFCSTGGTGSRLLPTGVNAFQHYFINTRGYSATSFTFGTSPTGTAGTQVNLTGTVGTHHLWVKWSPT